MNSFKSSFHFDFKGGDDTLDSLFMTSRLDTVKTIIMNIIFVSIYADVIPCREEDVCANVAI